MLEKQNISFRAGSGQRTTCASKENLNCCELAVAMKKAETTIKGIMKALNMRKMR